MKRIYSSLFLLVLCLLTACSYHFELEGSGEPSRLVLYCYPGSGDTTVIRLSRSIPVHGEVPPPLQGEEAEVRFSVNGREVLVHWTPDSLPGVPAHNHYVTGKLHEGDRIELSASCAEWDPVSASTVIPPAFPLQKVDLQQVPGNPNRMRFLITFRDEASTTDYYALRIERKVSTLTDGRYEARVIPIEFDISKEPLLSVSSGLDDILLIDHKYRWNLYYWNDTKVQGQAYTIRLDASYEPDHEGDYITPWGTEHVSYKVNYRISLYSLSEELYKYLKSVNEQKGALNSAGLAPLRPTYSNVHQGIGVVGGCQFYQTGWLDNLTSPE